MQSLPSTHSLSGTIDSVIDSASSASVSRPSPSLFPSAPHTSPVHQSRDRPPFGRSSPSALRVPDGASPSWDLLPRSGPDSSAAATDSLTGLPTRDRLRTKLQALLDAPDPGPCVLLCLDLDHFGRVNDSLGRSGGDALLAAVARVLRDTIREQDRVARIGGDEFAVCLTGLDAPEQARAIADTLHDRLNRPVYLGDRAVFAPVSIGGVGLADYDDADAVLRAADTALHEAKKIPHRAFVAYEPGMTEHADTQLSLDAALRRALNRGEFVPFFQPIVDLSNGHLHGFEVLARWDHPEKGILAPDLFLEAAEATGLIVPIGHQVIRKACAAVGALSPRNGTPPTLTANFSRQEFFRADTHAFLTDLFATHDLPPRTFTMEISERTVSGITPEDVTAFRALKNLGVSILLDDFGTGISSLQSLRRLPVDGLKIDRALLSGSHGQPWDRDLVDLIVQMGHTLDQTVTAEGVETVPQLRALHEMGCSYGQGYLLARPAPASRIESLLDEPFRTMHWSS